MKTLTNQQAFSRKLPKWAQLKLTGRPISVPQAKDIIFKTDRFFTNLSRYSGGNDRAWNAAARHVLGYDMLSDLEDLSYDRSNDIDQNTVSELLQRTQRELGFVCSVYVHNDWASTSYVYGPYGWCWPDGQLCCVDNVGQNPTVEELYNDFFTLWRAFPYLCLTATVMDGPFSQANLTPIVTFCVNTTGVHMTDEHDRHHYPVKRPYRDIEEGGAKIFAHGVPNDWVRERGDLTKPIIRKLITDAGIRLPHHGIPE